MAPSGTLRRSALILSLKQGLQLLADRSAGQMRPYAFVALMSQGASNLFHGLARPAAARSNARSTVPLAASITAILNGRSALGAQDHVPFPRSICTVHFAGTFLVRRTGRDIRSRTHQPATGFAAGQSISGSRPSRHRRYRGYFLAAATAASNSVEDMPMMIAPAGLRLKALTGRRTSPRVVVTSTVVSAASFTVPTTFVPPTP